MEKLSFTVLQGQPRPTQSVGAEDRGRVAAGTRLLLLGEQQLFLTALAVVLSGQGYDVLTCACQAEAMDAVRAGAMDICILELQYDDSDLLRSVSEIVRSSSSTRVVVLSGSSNSHLLAKQYSTVRSHIQHLLAKLGVHSKLEAVALAVSEGLVRVPVQR